MDKRSTAIIDLLGKLHDRTNEPQTKIIYTVVATAVGILGVDEQIKMITVSYPNRIDFVADLGGGGSNAVSWTPETGFNLEYVKTHDVVDRFHKHVLS